jgi:predicted transcriptional regulator
MRRPTTFPYAMTLRLSADMETGLEDLAYTLRLSRAGTIRRILRGAIAAALRNELCVFNSARQGPAQ